jgi:hypothetical protein
MPIYLGTVGVWEGEIIQPTEEIGENQDESGEETLDLAKAATILKATSGPEDFDVQYEAAVFVTGGYLLEEAMAAMREWLEFDQESRLLMIPLIEAMAEEQLGRMEEAKAEVALEESDWGGAKAHAKQASAHYSEGGKTSLNSSLPTARVMQEKLLNTGFQWEVQFRRRLERGGKQTLQGIADRAERAFHQPFPAR